MCRVLKKYVTRTVKIALVLGVGYVIWKILNNKETHSHSNSASHLHHHGHHQEQAKASASFPVSVVFAAILKSGQVKNGYENFAELFAQASSYWIDTKQKWEETFDGKEVSIEAISPADLPEDDEAEIVVLFYTNLPEHDIPKNSLDIQKIIKKRNLSPSTYYMYPRDFNPLRYGFQKG